MNIKRLPVLLGIACFLFAAQLLAQADPVIDSLQRIIDTARHDTTRINALVQQAQRYRRKDPDKALSILDRAVQEARKGNSLRHLRKALLSTGITYGMQGKYTEALANFHESLELSRKMGDSLFVASDYSNLGIVYKSLGDYGRSLGLYLRAMQLYDSLGDRSGVAGAYHNMGVVHDLMQEPDRALDCYLQAANISSSLGEDVSSLYNNIGLVMSRMGRHEEALKYLLLFLENSRKESKKMEEADALMNIGHVYWEMKDYPKAVRYNRQALDMCRVLGRKSGEHAALWNLGRAYLDQGDLPGALQVAKEILIVTDSLSSPIRQSEAHQLVARIYAAAGQHRNAYEHLERYSMLRDSIFNSDKAQAYQQWQSRLEVAEKDNHLQQQALELELLQTRAKGDMRMRLLLAVALAMLALVSFFLLYRYRLRHKVARELEIRNQRIESQNREIESINLELEKRMLRAQINPHFLFNSLSSIQHFISINDRNSALRYLSRFTSLLRQMLEQSTGTQVVLADEIKLLKNYLELEALRFEKDFVWSVEADEQVDIYNTEVPILLVQPYVENAILHGLVPKKGKGQLSVHFSDAGAYTVCTIRDNGIGRQASQAMQANSLRKRSARGLSITEQRLALLAADKAGADLVQIHDLWDEEKQPAGTEVIVRIPKSLK